MAADIVRHYSTDDEQGRLIRTPHGRLEFLRTQELLRRALPPATNILDVGGGTGVHAEWLAADGHPVHLIDLVPAHVEAARRLPGVSAAVGDARTLPVEDGSVDAVLLLGPLYHLVDVRDRARALAEARRVLRPGGLLAAAGISRYLSVLEKGANGTLDEDLLPSVAEVIASGRYDGHAGFTTTHWHTAAELGAELSDAGFAEVTVYGIEGPAWPALDTAGVLEFSARLPAALRCARLVETDPLLVNASAHLLAVGTVGGSMLA
jgi:ubiquinone/menaquinone biosynthesis C-methylase UbiE